MSNSLRKIVGTLAIMIFLAAYIAVATIIGGSLPANRWIWLIFYPVVGTAWGLPLIPLLSWMNKGR
ncbi:hypothetical protein BH11PSE2_BH11PSE2_04230 [soil metagenome]